jgi:hypothetical protein
MDFRRKAVANVKKGDYVRVKISYYLQSRFPSLKNESFHKVYKISREDHPWIWIKFGGESVDLNDSEYTKLTINSARFYGIMLPKEKSRGKKTIKSRKKKTKRAENKKTTNKASAK